MLFETLNHDESWNVLPLPFLHLFDALSEGVCVYGEDKKIIYANQNLCRMLNVSNEVLIGASLNKYLRSSHRDILSLLITAGTKKIENMLVEFNHIMGHNIFFRLWADSHYDENETYKGTIFMISDVLSAQGEFNESLSQQKEHVSELLNFHEYVKNDMLIINSLISMQSHKYYHKMSHEFSSELIRRINVLKIVYDLLCASEDHNRINLREYIPELIYSLRKCSCFSSVMPIIDIEEVLISYDNARYVGLLVSELVSNALKHAFPQGMHGSVRVTVERKGMEVILSVCDDGIGMPGNYNLEAPSTMGLELVTCLVKQFEGTMEVLSRKGTEFRIIFDNSVLQDQ